MLLDPHGVARRLSYDAAAFPAAFRAEVDDVVGGFDDLGVLLCAKIGTASAAGRSREVMEVAVRASWDPEASVWVAESDDVPGLVTEADDIEALVAKLEVLIPELLEANGVALTQQDEVAFVLTASRRERVGRHAA